MSGPYGLRIRNASNVVVFDSTAVVGSVCLGRYTVATGGSTFTFPALPGSNGRFMFLGAASNTYSVDNSLGYPRFIFGGIGVTYDVLLFAF